MLLSRNRLGDVGISILGQAIAKNKELVVLDISNNNLTFRGIEKLFDGLRNNYSLIDINLASRHGPFKNIMGNQGAKQIANFLSFQQDSCLL